MRTMRGKGTIENHFKDPAFTLRKRNLIPFFLLEKICTVLRQPHIMPRLFGHFVVQSLYTVSFILYVVSNEHLEIQKGRLE